ncbi:hypothetical protein PENSPDRAFT_114116 [Peniophora sp. CONT]|nr:hypothetical protein PENSPDRAFT_114116 [Peniophora sp. CONT]
MRYLYGRKYSGLQGNIVQILIDDSSSNASRPLPLRAHLFKPSPLVSLEALTMPLRSFLKQSAKGVANVGASYRHQCVEAIRICRSLKSENALHSNEIRSHLLLELACTALDSAAREATETDGAFAAFREAVEELRRINKAAMRTENNMKLAKTRDDSAADQHRSILSKLSARSTERNVLSFGGATGGSLHTFIVAPCEHTVPIKNISLLQLNFHVDRVATLPELVFRFHRKHRQWFPEQQPLKSPHFYTKGELHDIDKRAVLPLDNTSVSTLEQEDTIWVYGDRSPHYELARDVRRSRIRSVSFAPAYNGLQRVYKDICGYLALERFIFGDDFSPWVESAAVWRDFKPSACIREDPRLPRRAIIEESNTSLADVTIVGIVAQEVVNRVLESAPLPAQAPFDGYITERMFASVNELTMPGALPVGRRNDAAQLLALNPLTRHDWWGLRPTLTAIVEPVRTRFWGRP